MILYSLILTAVPLWFNVLAHKLQ